MAAVYRAFAFLGAMTPFAAFLFGFRFEPGAPKSNILFNVTLYAGFVAIHLIMTRPWFKRRTYGKAEGSPAERRVYISIAVVTWILVLILHRPVPGPSLMLPAWVNFLGVCAALLCLVAAFEGTTFAMISGMFAVPGAEMRLSHGEETALLTEGSYGRVRHPMYRSAILLALSSLFVHANAAQLLWVVFFAAPFIAWIPLEEAQLVAQRGDAYRAYMERTPWRLFRGIW